MTREANEKKERERAGGGGGSKLLPSPIGRGEAVETRPFEVTLHTEKKNRKQQKCISLVDLCHVVFQGLSRNSFNALHGMWVAVL